MGLESMRPNSRAGLHRSEEETILESSLESFPASDPPAWVSGKDFCPKDTYSGSVKRSQECRERHGLIARIIDRCMKTVRRSQDLRSEKHPPCGSCS